MRIMMGAQHNTWAAISAFLSGVSRFLDVVLHLGAHRTGTTTLQAYVRNNRESFRKTGIEFWGPERTRSKLFYGLIRNPARIDHQVRQQGERSFDKISNKIARCQAGGTKSLLVSEENMIGVMKDNLTKASLYPDTVARLEWLAQVFGGHCNRIALSIRSYESYWSSVLAFTLARGWPLPDRGELELLVKQPRRWCDVIKDISTVFPTAKIVVWPFEAFAGQAPHQLAMIRGGTGPVFTRSSGEWHNASARCRQLRRSLARRGDFADAARLPDQNTRWQPFSARQIAVFQEQYAQDIAWLRAGAGGRATFYENSDSEQTKVHSWALTGERGQFNDQKERFMG